MAAIVLRPQAPKPEERVVMAPPPERPAIAPSVIPNPAPFTEPDPQVSVHAVPGANAPANTPAANGPAGNTPAVNGPAGNTPLGNMPAANTPAANRPRIMVRTSPLPDAVEPSQPPAAPEADKAAPAAPPVNSEPDVRPMEPAPRPRLRAVDPPPRPVAPPAPEPVRETGRVSIFFDADSSTYDHHGNRMPLRVEVYVDGQKRLTSDDPEKKSFNLGRIAEGEHNVEIVPYVGDLPSEARKERIRVFAGERNEYKAVLRRSDGTSRIGKFRGRD
jgi:hypothetical protein